MRSWLNGYDGTKNMKGTNYSGAGNNFLNMAFSPEEQEAIPITVVENPVNPIYNSNGGNDTNDKIFLLSIQEAINTSYGFSDKYIGNGYYEEDEEREAINTGYASLFHYMNSSGKTDWWWLRSPGNSDNRAALVTHDGRVFVDGNDVENTFAVRPALNLNLSSVIFTSAAVGGKSATAGSVLVSATAPTDSVKFTVFDDENLELADVQQTGYDSNARIVTFSYSGATTGKPLSAIVKNSNGDVTHYGRLIDSTDVSGTGTAKVTLPTGFNPATDTIEIFVEEINKDYYTDFCSKTKVLSVDTSAPNITGHPQDVIKTEGETADFSVTATGTGLTYQWQVSEDNGTSWNNVTTGGTSANHTTATTTTQMNGYQYRCIVTDTNNSTITSYAATLTVNAASFNHNWVTNGNGTHKCTRIGGCVVTDEACSPHGNAGDTCGKCGYITPDPTCPHANTTTTNNPGPTCTEESASVTVCDNCNGTLSSEKVNALGHNWITDGNGTHSCTRSDCGVTETCSPNTIGAACSTCGSSTNGGNNPPTNGNNTPEPTYTFYTVTFNGNGGTPSQTSLTVSGGDAIGTLPTATRDGFSFKGWFTNADGGEQISESTKIIDNITFFAG